MAKKAPAKMLCVYCRKGVVEKLPAKCPACGKKLSEQITPKMKLRRLVELAFDNGVQLNFRAVPIKKKRKTKAKA